MNGKLRALIVDDEALARRVLREELAAHEDVEVVGECENGFEAVKAAAERAPDLVFLDVQMPKLDGFEVAELLGDEASVIFVTAYDEFALKAFDLHAVDYLLKPFSSERLALAIARARERRGARSQPSPAALAASARQPGVALERVLVRDGARVHVIPKDSIDYVEAQDDYVSIRSEGKAYLKEQTLAALESSLDPKQFVRVHRSYLLNVDRIQKLEPYAKESRVAILKDGTRLPVSRAGYARLKSLL